MNLSDWIKRQLKDDGAATISLELAQSATSWQEAEVVQVWDRSAWENVDEWLEDAENLVSALKEDLPTRRHTLVYTARDEHENPRSQHRRTLTGTNKDVAKGSDLAAATQAITALSGTMEKVLGVANAQLETARNVIRAQGTAFEAQTQLILELRRDSLSERKPTEADQLIAGVIKEIPGLIQAWAAGELGGNPMNGKH